VILKGTLFYPVGSIFKCLGCHGELLAAEQIVLLFHGLQYLFQLFKFIWLLLFGLEFFAFNNGTVESSYLFSLCLVK